MITYEEMNNPEFLKRSRAAVWKKVSDKKISYADAALEVGISSITLKKFLYSDEKMSRITILKILCWSEIEI